MNKLEIVNKINKFIGIIDHTSNERVRNIIKEHLEEIKGDIEQLSRESLKWSVDDFISQAMSNKGLTLGMSFPKNSDPFVNPEYCLKTYDPLKFQDALERMIEKHDAEIGITWETIKCYLDEMCQVKAENIIFWEDQGATQVIWDTLLIGKMLVEIEEQIVIDYLKQFHTPGEHEIVNELFYGSSDKVYIDGQYVLLYNKKLNYIALEYKI